MPRDLTDEARDIATKITARPVLNKLVSDGKLSFGTLLNLRDDIAFAIREAEALASREANGWQKRLASAEAIVRALANGWKSYGSEEHGKLSLLRGTLGAWHFKDAHDHFAKYPDPLPPAANPWREIASAPKDGTDILLVGKGGEYHVAFWNGSSWDDGDFNNNLGTHMTHWMPLPCSPHKPSPESGEPI